MCEMAWHRLIAQRFIQANFPFKFPLSNHMQKPSGM